MPYTVAGTLKLPETGKPAAGVILKFVALQSISPVLDRSESVIITSATGAYSIQLEYNTYSVFATLYDNKPINCGQIVLNSTLATGLDLPTLLNGGYSEPTTPSWIVELQRLANVTTSAAQAAAASVAASSASAAAAASSAAQARQISGLSTVAEAIGLAVLPIPDVWAPLSDSLRLITGYGRDVLVGSDVVARMVTFSRNSTATYIGKDGLLKTASANEPRFEKEGLLIEGQSTNIWPTQIGGGDILNTVIEATQLPDGVVGNSYKITPTPGAFAYIRRSYTEQTGAHSMSCYAKSGDSTGRMPDLYSGISGRFDTKMVGVAIGNGWWRMSAKLDSPTGNTGIGFGLQATETTPVYVWGMQLEALPFASSYIPTEGAAATRAADVAYLPAPGNISSLGFSVAAEFDTQRGVVDGLDGTACLFSMEQSGRARMVIGRGKYGSSDSDYGFFTHCGAYGSTGYLTTVLRDYTVKSKSGVAVTSEGAGLLKLRVNSSLSTIASTTATNAPVPATLYIGAYGGPGVSPLFGHIRNFRVWMKSLTEAQMRAVA